jgi:hypothetical protein
MNYDKELIARKMLRWENFLTAYQLPKWEDLPDFGLYMDQVITLLSQHLYYLPQEDHSEELVTPTAINNYVRLKIMPAPEKKRYRRIHLAYLFMICTLKQTITIAQVQKIIPVGLEEEEIKQLYSNYVARHIEVGQRFIENIHHCAEPMLDPNNTMENATVENMIAGMVMMSGYYRLLAEKIIGLKGYAAAEVIDGQPLPQK